MNNYKNNYYHYLKRHQIKLSNKDIYTKYNHEKMFENRLNELDLIQKYYEPIENFVYNY